MQFIELVKITLLFVATLLSFTAFGGWIVQLVTRVLRVKRPKEVAIESVGVNLAVGAISFGYVALILGLLGQFNRTSLSLAMIIVFLLGARTLRLPRIKLDKSLISFILTLITLVMLGTAYLAAMQPPHTSDELNYHFPQAQEIVNKQQVDLRFGGHGFYGNIPKQMEVLYAAGISLSGYSYAHSLHFLFLIALILIIYGVFTRVYGTRTATIAVFMLLLYDDFIWNLTSGFVDGAAFVQEISALLIAIAYLREKENKFALIQTGLLLGGSLSIKYSTGFTVLFIAILYLSQIKKIFYLIIPALLTGGFWYIKNLIWFTNPFYPMYFGHKGMPQDEYDFMIANIQQFGPRTIPYFFKNLAYFREIPRLPVYWSLILSPIALFIKKQRKLTILLFLYALSFLLYWFFLGTHQFRFIAPGFIATILLSSIWISQIPSKLLIAVFITVNLYMWKVPYYDQSVLSFFWSTKFHLTERQYALGNLTQDEFMYRWYGCYYSAVAYMNTVQGNEDVADIWSLNIDFNVPFYAKQHPFVFSTDANAKYLYVRQSAKNSFISRFNAKQELDYEKIFINNAELVWSKDDCQIYKHK